MYRLILESLLGLRLETDKLFIEPCLPEHWESFKIHYRYRETLYHILIRQKPEGERKENIPETKMDDNAGFIQLVDDHQEHTVEYSFDRAGSPGYKEAFSK
jgi:cellobiose phosphorylase